MTGVKWIVACAAVLFVVFDSPYGAWAVHRVLGPPAPRPDWLVLPPQALVIAASHTGPASAQIEGGTVRYATTLFAPQTAKFHAETLTKRGFVAVVSSARDIGPATARAFGILNRVDASDPEKGLIAKITVLKSESLLFGNRFVEIAWSRHTPGATPSAPSNVSGTGFSTLPGSF
jgi:hypothetical protein